MPTLHFGLENEVSAGVFLPERYSANFVPFPYGLLPMLCPFVYNILPSFCLCFISPFLWCKTVDIIPLTSYSTHINLYSHYIMFILQSIRFTFNYLMLEFQYILLESYLLQFHMAPCHFPSHYPTTSIIPFHECLP